MQAKTKLCIDCGLRRKREELSNQGLCYSCARKRLLAWFKQNWVKWHKKGE